MATIYVKHKAGGLHALSGRREAKLRREILAGRGGREVVALVLAGYEGFLNDAGEVEDFESLNDHFAKHPEGV